MGMAAWEEDPLDGPGDQIEGPDGDTGGGGRKARMASCTRALYLLFVYFDLFGPIKIRCPEMFFFLKI